MTPLANISLSSFNTTLNISTSSNYLNFLNFFFNHIYLLLLVIIGGVGNGFVIIIFGQRALRTTIGSIGSNMSVYPFLFYMAISDTLYLLILFCLWLSNYVNVLHRSIICQLTLYLTYVCNFINAYYTVSFTSQRLFAVIQPFHVSHVLSWDRSRRLALSIIIIACLMYSYLPFLVGIVNGRCYSLEHLRWINKLMDIIDCVIVFLIPYLIIITMNTIILISLRRMKQSQDELFFQNNSQLNKRREITRRNASRKMTKLLLTVSTSYLIICAPYACMHTWHLLNENVFFQKKFLRQLEYYFHLIYHISFGMNFYIYMVFDSKFRRELKRFFLKCKRNFQSCFRHKNDYENDDLNNENNSSSLEQFQLMNQNSSSCPAITTNGCTFKYKWKQPKSLYP